MVTPDLFGGDINWKRKPLIDVTDENNIVTKDVSPLV